MSLDNLGADFSSEEMEGQTINSSVDLEELEQSAVDNDMKLREEYQKYLNLADSIADKHPELVHIPGAKQLYDAFKLLLETVDQPLTEEKISRINLAYQALKGYVKVESEESSAPYREDADDENDGIKPNKVDENDPNNDYLDKHKDKYPQKYLNMLKADMDMIKAFGFSFDAAKNVRDNVKALQIELKRVGATDKDLATITNPGGIDGLYGPKTRAALTNLGSQRKTVDTVAENERMNLKIQFDNFIKEYSELDLSKFKTLFEDPSVKAEQLLTVLKSLEARREDYKIFKEVREKMIENKVDPRVFKNIASNLLSAKLELEKEDYETSQFHYFINLHKQDFSHIYS